MKPPNRKPFVILCSNVPPSLLDKVVAKIYFSTFGKIKSIRIRRKSQCCLIEYCEERGLLNALETSGEFQGQLFKVSELAALPEVRDAKADSSTRTEIDLPFESSSEKDLKSEDAAPNSASKPKHVRKRAPKPPTKRKPTAEIYAGMAPAEVELFKIIKQPAWTIEEKYKILDARDKLLRIKLKRNPEVTKAQATVGTCPDMCPEKERLLRVIQHQVALYEQETNGKGMNASLAIKQYSRSSADQEAPLPEELRPVAVLQMTMGYLMHNIIDMCNTPDVNIAEWYHFLWDRTRSIRKDIIQQELCCQRSVELVEQCARFHILCSARLVSEDPSVFDQKINTENLTKCLQTLKYMYHDLELNGEWCPNEAEFRAYIILLNLNDGNFMWEVQHLRPQIQKSREVRFALNVHSSLDKNNYVKFFKLVRSTTYLNACILMRYFVQIRQGALNILLKCFSSRAHLASMPVTDLTRNLAFESDETAIEFIETYGLNTNSERTHVILDKKSFSIPEYPCVMDRAINTIESKQTCSIGEVVCGKKLPPKTYQSHVPQNSFDEGGYLIKREQFLKDFNLSLATDVDIVEDDKEVSMIVDTKEDSVMDFKENYDDSFPSDKQEIVVQVDFHQPAFTREQAKEKIPSPVKPSFSIPAFSFATNVSSAFSFIPQPINELGVKKITSPKLITSDLVAKITETPSIVPATNVQTKINDITNIRPMLQNRVRPELSRKSEAQLHKKRKAVDEQGIKRKLLVQNEKHAQIQHKERNLKLDEINNDVIYILTNLLLDVVAIVKQSKLTEIEASIKRRQLQRFALKWKNNARRKSKLKIVDFTPTWINSLSIRDNVNELKISNGHLTDSEPFQSEALNPRKLSIGRIDLFRLTYNTLAKKYSTLYKKIQREIFWKITFSLPGEPYLESSLKNLDKIIQCCLQWTDRRGLKVALEHVEPECGPRITYCVEKQKGAFGTSECDSQGYIFLATEFDRDLNERILNTLQNFGLFVKVPIVLILARHDNDNTKLELLIKEGVIANYLVLVDDFTPKNVLVMLEDAITFLSCNVEKNHHLQMDTLKSFLLKYLCGEFWKRIGSFAKWNSQYRERLTQMNVAIALQNEALLKLKSILLDKVLLEYPKFPEIFRDYLHNKVPDCLPCDYRYFPSFWDKTSYIEHIDDVLQNFALPKFLQSWPPRNKADLELHLFRYCEKVFNQPDKVFYKVMSILLEQCDLNDNFKSIEHLALIDIIELMTVEKISETSFSLYGTGFVSTAFRDELIAVYDYYALNQYINSDWFYINNPIIKGEVCKSLKSDKPKVRRNLSLDSSLAPLDIDLDLLLSNDNKNQHKNTKARLELLECNALLNDLSDSFAVHRKIQERAGNMLTTILKNK